MRVIDALEILVTRKGIDERVYVIERIDVDKGGQRLTFG